MISGSCRLWNFIVFHFLVCLFLVLKNILKRIRSTYFFDGFNILHFFFGYFSYISGTLTSTFEWLISLFNEIDIKKSHSVTYPLFFSQKYCQNKEDKFFSFFCCWKLGQVSNWRCEAYDFAHSFSNLNSIWMDTHVSFENFEYFQLE